MKLMNEPPERVRRPDRGATAVEYSILVALVAAIIVLTVQAVGFDVLGLWASADW